MARALVGTSGWTYASWRGAFYPEDLPSRRHLAFYAREFQTTEVNYSFYHLPRPQTFANWAAQVPPSFVFAVKASRFITHTKRLLEVEEPWRNLVENARALARHLGPILLQFPASFPRDSARLAQFLDMAQGVAPSQPPLRLIFEFRHDSWFTAESYRLLERHGACLCIADSPGYPRQDILTADFAYFRFHGRTRLFGSEYSEAELAEEAKRMKRYLRDGVDVYAYFNNDARGYAVKNARSLKARLEG